MHLSHHIRTVLIAVFVAFMVAHPLHASPGVFVFGGDLILEDSSTTIFEILGTAPGSGYDQYAVTGNITFNNSTAQLFVDLNTFVPSYGDVFQIVTYGSRTDKFGRIRKVFVTTNLALAPVYDFPGTTNPLYSNTPFAPAPNSLTLFTTLPGDTNFDLKVESADLSLLLKNFGMTGANWLDGDFTGDRIVNNDDLSLLLANFGHSVTIGQPGLSPAPTINTIPEPATLAILSLGGLMLARRRRSR